MAHDPLFEQRIGDALNAQRVSAEPKRMFGGVAFMVRGHMSVGITNKGQLMVRFDPTRHAEILKWPGALPMTYGKGEMKGFLFVDPATVEGRPALDRWVKLSMEHVMKLPAKAVKKAAVKKVSTAVKPKPAAKKTVKRK